MSLFLTCSVCILEKTDFEVNFEWREIEYLMNWNNVNQKSQSGIQGKKRLTSKDGKLWEEEGQLSLKSILFAMAGEKGKERKERKKEGKNLSSLTVTE